MLDRSILRVANESRMTYTESPAPKPSPLLNLRREIALKMLIGQQGQTKKQVEKKIFFYIICTENVR